MDYRICEADAAAGLEGQVKQLIEQGWRPAGGLSVVQGQSGKWRFYQAMTREKAGPGAGAEPPSKPWSPGSGDFD